MAVTPTVHPTGPAEVSHALSLHGYLPDDGLATSVFLALALKRPLHPIQHRIERPGELSKFNVRFPTITDI